MLSPSTQQAATGREGAVSWTFPPGALRKELRLASETAHVAYNAIFGDPFRKGKKNLHIASDLLLAILWLLMRIPRLNSDIFGDLLHCPKTYSTQGNNQPVLRTKSMSNQAEPQLDGISASLQPRAYTVQSK